METPSKGTDGSGQVLISYAHENDRHRDLVRQFADLLAAAGVDVELDQFAEYERVDWADWTLRKIQVATRVLIIISPSYRHRFEGTCPVDEGRGVQFEGLLIREEIYRDHRVGLRKFVPILFPGARQADIPTLLLPHSGRHYPISELTTTGVEHIVALLRKPPSNDDREAVDSPSSGVGPHAAVQLIISNGPPSAADDAARALLSAGAGGTATFGTDTRTTGGVVIGPPAVVLGAYTRAVRAIQRRTREQRQNGASGLRAELGAHIAPRADEAWAVATSLARGDAARRMHAVPDADLVLVVSPAFLQKLREAAPGTVLGGFFRECAGLGMGGESCWIAVPGRSQAPPLPPDPPADLPPVAEKPAAEPPSGQLIFNNSGRFEGLVQHVDGDATLHIVQNFGTRP